MIVLKSKIFLGLSQHLWKKLNLVVRAETRQSAGLYLYLYHMVPFMAQFWSLCGVCYIGENLGSISWVYFPVPPGDRREDELAKLVLPLKKVLSVELNSE